VITAAQLRAARALLGVDQRTLAELSVWILGVEPVGREPAQPLESLALEKSGQQFRLCIVE
jgi:hypothetical protein